MSGTKLDPIDRKILMELQGDGRMTNVELSRRVGISVSLKSQAEADLVAFEDLARSWPLVRECHMLNGEIDFLLKCMAPNLLTFQTFLTGSLTAAPNVASVKTSLVIRAAKDEPGVPFEMSDHLAAEQV
jgi:DNA-binding Lrp family transcriptional regulator